MVNQDLKTAIAEMVNQRGDVTFAEREEIPGFAGEHAHAFVDDKMNMEILLWSGLSSEAGQALGGLLMEKSIAAFPCSVLYYFISGRAPDVPIFPTSRMQPSKPFKKRKVYWQPMAFGPYARVKENNRIPLTFGFEATPPP